MDLTEFNHNYLNKRSMNISKEQKSIFLLGDFNINLLNYNEHNQKNEFLDSLACNSFIHLMLLPTRITSYSNTLIDNIFSVIDPDTGFSLQGGMGGSPPMYACPPKKFLKKLSPPRVQGKLRGGGIPPIKKIVPP